MMYRYDSFPLSSPLDHHAVVILLCGQPWNAPIPRKLESTPHEHGSQMRRVFPCSDLSFLRGTPCHILFLAPICPRCPCIYSHTSVFAAPVRSSSRLHAARLMESFPVVLIGPVLGHRRQLMVSTESGDLTTAARLAGRPGSLADPAKELMCRCLRFPGRWARHAALAVAGQVGPSASPQWVFCPRLDPLGNPPSDISCARMLSSPACQVTPVCPKPSTPGRARLGGAGCPWASPPNHAMHQVLACLPLSRPVSARRRQSRYRGRHTHMHTHLEHLSPLTSAALTLHRRPQCATPP